MYYSIDCGIVRTGDVTTNDVDLEGRIVGGKEAVRGQFPWQAQIHARSGEKFRLACGGTLVSDHVVVTAGGRIIAITNLNSNDIFTWIFTKN